MKNAFHMYIAFHIVPAQPRSFQPFESVSIVRTSCHPTDKAYLARKCSLCSIYVLLVNKDKENALLVNINPKGKQMMALAVIMFNVLKVSVFFTFILSSCL